MIGDHSKTTFLPIELSQILGSNNEVDTLYS